MKENKSSLIDNRINLKLPKERGEIVLSRVKALIVKEYGSLHGYFADVILNMIDYSCDIIEKDPKSLLRAHTHNSQDAKKRYKIAQVFRFTERWGTYFDEKARLFDDFKFKIEEHFQVTDPRSVNPKIKEVCKRLRLSILRLHDGHRVILSIYADAYKTLERYDEKFKGRRLPPRETEQIAAYKAIMRDITPQKKKQFEPVVEEDDEGMQFLEALGK